MFHYFRPQDIADILIMSFFLYQLYRWFRNTRALQVGIGIGILMLLYFVTKSLDLFMTSWILQELGTVLFILIIVIFQTEIRQALYRFSLLRNLFGQEEKGSRLDLMEISNVVFRLAAERTGAIIVFQRKESLDDCLMHGVRIDGLVTGPLVAGIFMNANPLHDGAVIIKGDRITEASTHLPLSSNMNLPQHLGTRHRAALGLSERSDAVVVVVSEERGEVSVAVGGEFGRIESSEHLTRTLGLLLAAAEGMPARLSLRKRLLTDLRPKLVTVVLVTGIWLVITSRQGGITTITVPIKFHNLPADFVLTGSDPERVEVQVRALSGLLPLPRRFDSAVDIDLGKVHEGANRLPVGGNDLQLPLGVFVNDIKPGTVMVEVEKKVRKSLRVQVPLTGRLPQGLRLRKITVVPATVPVEGPENLLSRLESVRTEEVRLDDLRGSSELTAAPVSPGGQVIFLQKEPLRIQVLVSGRAAKAP